MIEKNSADYKEFHNIISDIINHPATQHMKKFKQHYNCTCFDHCLAVSYYSYKICKHLNLDYTSMARAAMLHDLFLYDWRVKQPGRKGFHAFTHPYTAYRRASSLFNLNKKEKDIIIKHMWPITIIPPKYAESFIITLVDKYCALSESYTYYSEKFVSKKSFRYASILMFMLLVHIP